MKRLLFLVSIACALNAQGQSVFFIDSSVAGAMELGGVEPASAHLRPFKYYSTDGVSYTNDSLLGKITFINFWFEGCMPCVAEFSALNDLYHRYRDKSDFRFLSFTYDSPETIKRVQKKYKIDFPVIFVPHDSIHRLLFNLAFPASLITNREGRVAYIKSGGTIDEDYSKAEIDRLFLPRLDLLLSKK